MGFLPMLSGGLLAVFSLFQTIKEIKEQTEQGKMKVDWKKTGLLLVIVCLVHGGAGNRGLCDFYLPAAACLRKAVWSRFLDKAFDIFLGVFWGQLLYICGASAGAASIAAVYRKSRF